MEYTLSIIKPDGIRNKHMGAILQRFEEEGLEICAMRLSRLSSKEAEGFYAEHRERPFFQELVDFMCSGPLVLLVLKGKDAIVANRRIMGATDPKEAAQGSLRQLYAASIGENTVHGSDSPEAAAREIAYFFPQSHLH